MTRKKRKVILRPAPVWKRILAFIVDMLILEFFVFSQFEEVIKSLTPTKTSVFVITGEFIQISIVMGIIGFIVFIYFTVLETAFGQSLGHMAVALRLYSVDELSLWKIAISNLTFLPFFPFILLWIIDPLMLLFSNNHQRFMHTLVGLQVVEEFSVYNTLEGI